MTIAEFWQVCTSDVPGDELLKNTHLLSLWYDHKGDWEKSHELIQDLNDHKAAAIHAYLHRKEGDIWNADYWYRRANAKRKDISLEEEWQVLVEELISQTNS